MKVLVHPGPYRHEPRKLRVLPPGAAFVMIVAALVTLFILLFVSIEAR